MTFTVSPFPPEPAADPIDYTQAHLDAFTARVREYMPLAGQLVLLYRSDIVRFVGMGMDDQDFYYITVGFKNRRKYVPSGHATTWNTAVGHMDALKPYLPADVYKGMDDHYTMNDLGPRKFSILIEKNGTLQAYTLTDEGLVEIPHPPEDDNA